MRILRARVAELERATTRSTSRPALPSTNLADSGAPHTNTMSQSAINDSHDTANGCSEDDHDSQTLVHNEEEQEEQVDDAGTHHPSSLLSITTLTPQSDNIGILLPWTGPTSGNPLGSKEPKEQ